MKHREREGEETTKPSEYHFSQNKREEIVVIPREWEGGRIREGERER